MNAVWPGGGEVVGCAEATQMAVQAGYGRMSRKASGLSAASIVRPTLWLSSPPIEHALICVRGAVRAF